MKAMAETAVFQTRRTSKGKQRTASKVDPSFKSKRYRDKLRTEVKALETLIPIDRPTLNRKLDSQTVYRLVIAYLRVNAYFKATRKPDEKLLEHVGHELQPGETKRNAKEEDARAPSGEKLQEMSESEASFEHLNFQQGLDGFVLVLSIDGTIMYVTENIQQLLGFNQVDLIHRCIYGVVHPADQAQVRDVLEHSGQFSYQRNHIHGTSRGSRSDTHSGDSVPVSIYCRLKCFNRNSSGYSKFHCTGKLQEVPGMLKSPKSSTWAALLYFRPFLMTDGVTSQETNRGMFWSKHDLDLKISAAEERIEEALGYQATELCGTSLYQLVHPDDLCLLVHVHRTITELNEIQSFYLRLQSKDGAWVWLHSKGKVVCKNSKKFSLVFTHTPLRDDDSTFTDHEMLLRRKYSCHNLMSLSKPPSSEERTDLPSMFQTDPMTGQNIYGHLSCQNIKPQISLVNECPINSEISSILSQSEMFLQGCPSSWHMGSERHSPVVPSSQTAHKLSYRDKHLHVLERKHLNHDIQHPHANMFASVNNNKWSQMNNQAPFKNQGQRQDIDLRNSVANYDQYKLFPWHDPMMNNISERFCYVGCLQSQPYNYPPSPPPSPRSLGQFCWNPSQPSGYPIHEDTRRSSQSDITLFHPVINMNSGLPSYQGNHGPHQAYIQSHASIKVSMICNSSINYYTDPQQNPNGSLPQKLPAMLDTERHDFHDNFHQIKGTVQLTNQIKRDPNNSQSCAVTQDFPMEPAHCKQFDLEASMHMRIVESRGKGDNSMAEVNLPETDSFMEYLNS